MRPESPRVSRSVAAFLSFLIPGTGQLVTGRRVVGAIFLVPVVVAAVAAIVVARGDSGAADRVHAPADRPARHRGRGCSPLRVAVDRHRRCVVERRPRRPALRCLDPRARGAARGDRGDACRRRGRGPGRPRHRRRGLRVVRRRGRRLRRAACGDGLAVRERRADRGPRGPRLGGPALVAAHPGADAPAWSARGRPPRHPPRGGRRGPRSLEPAHGHARRRSASTRRAASRRSSRSRATW